MFNIYGYNTCGNDSISLAGQWRNAGLRVAPARLVGHCVSQVFYDGAWHLMDGDMHSIYLLRDNETVAGEQDLVRDHDLIRRTHTQGILQADRRAGDEWESSIYVFEGKVTGDRNTRGDTAMNMTLRPGEALAWRWGHVNPVKYHGQSPPRFPERVCNGRWEYHPDFTQRTWRRGASAVEAIKEDSGGLTAEAGKTGVVVWTMRSPYVFVGGNLEVDGAGAKFSLSWDGRSWEEAGNDLDRFFGPSGPARYVYYLRCQLSGQARLRKLRIVNDLQMAPLTLPGMGVGTNTFTYTDQSTGERKVRLTHHWVERSASRPPASPREPIFPPRGGETDGTDFVFQWAPAADPDGDAIADYHFELSDQADMRWPLSMSFAKLTSRTADAGHARFTLPGPGLLNPDHRYFWRVRAKTIKGCGETGARPGASFHVDRRPRWMSPSSSIANALGASSAGHPIPTAASPPYTVSTPAMKRAFPSATGPTPSPSENPRRCRPSPPRTLWSRPQPPNWRLLARKWNFQARTRRFTEWSRWTARARGAVLPTTPPP